MLKLRIYGVLLQKALSLFPSRYIRYAAMPSEANLLLFHGFVVNVRSHVLSSTEQTLVVEEHTCQNDVRYFRYRQMSTGAQKSGHHS